MLRAKDLAEVSEFLLKSDYSTELSKIPVKELDAPQMEKTFYQKLSERFSFLVQITSGKTREVLEEYYKGIEVENIKRIIEAMHGKEKIDEDRLIPIPRKYQTVNFSALLGTRTIREMIDLLKETPYRSLRDIVDLYEEYNNPLILEAHVEKTHYNNFWAKLEKASDKDEVKKLIGTEIDLKNLLYIFSFKHMKMKQDLLQEMLINIYYRLPKNLIPELINTSYESIPKVLTWPPYVELAKKVVDLLDKKMLTEAENIFSEYSYSYAEIERIRKPNNFAYIFAYLFLCFKEARNLTTLAIGKQLNLDEEKIRGSLFL
jgi:vacuolar-type H+-ATPase subunit C/Vma6